MLVFPYLFQLLIKQTLWLTGTKERGWI